VSSFLAQARTRALRPMAALPRPRLTVVARAATRAPRVPFVVLVVTLLIGGLVGLLLLNTALQRGAYTTTALRQQAEALGVRQQQLEIRVDAMAEPQRLAQRALRLGMVADASPGFLELATGKIVGAPVAGKRSNRLDVTGVGRDLAMGHLGHLGHPGISGRSHKATPVPAGALNSLGTAPIVVPDPNRRHGRPNAPTRPSNGSGTQPGVQYGGEAQGPNR
jgi:hypothetical protein